MYKFMSESGAIHRAKTQVGEVRRPLAAVSRLTEDQRNIVFFCQGEDWIIPRSDPLTKELIKLVQKIQVKTKMHQHKGTYRVRAWIMPETSRPFARQGA